MYRRIEIYLKLSFILFGIFGCLFCGLLSYIILPRNNFPSIGIPVSIGGGFIGILSGVFILSIYSRSDVRVKASYAIDFFRSIEFFSNMKDLTDLELFNLIDEEYQYKFGESLKPNNPFFDLHIAAFDKTRVWWKDTEADVCSGNNSYTRFINELSQISRGEFNPTNIIEEWKSEEGPITVKYNLFDTTLSINPNFIDDYLDVERIYDINHQLSSSVNFEMFLPFDQTVFILALTDHEKTLLRKKRNWSFYLVG